MKSQILRFGLAGIAGYVVDSVVLYVAMAVGLGFLRGRLLSFICAVVVTWLLNRRYTFADQLDATTIARSPLWLEFWRYLMAMSLGGFLNLATYWLVITIAGIPPHPAIPALGVAIGSLVGMTVNFASAKWWVFRKRDLFALSARALPALTTPVCLILAQAVFWICHLHDTALPGLYMDAVNPDYLAARTLNSELDNPVYLMPTALIPLLGNLYHGMQNYYVGLPVFALLGFNMLALRVAQGLFGSGILVLLHLVLQRATGSMRLAFAGSLGLATELAFVASFRTQMYIVIAGSFWLLWAVYLAFAPGPIQRQQDIVLTDSTSSGMVHSQVSMTPWFWSGLCTGLAAYSYFVFLFFVPVFVLMGWWHTRNWRAVGVWSMGFILGMQIYVIGYVSLILNLGGLTPAVAWLKTTLQELELASAELGVTGSLANAWLLTRITLENTANELMIFGTASPGRWPYWKTGLWLGALLFLAGFNFAKYLSRRRQHIDNKNGLLASWHVTWLPIVFVAGTLIFGTRLWGHHFTPLVPLMYLVLILAVYQLKKSMPFGLPKWVWGGLALFLVAGNLQQQRVFFERLEATGGVGQVSSAINRMAEDALSLPPELVHVFPEWGFFAPFAFLTANQRAYEIDVSPANLRRLASEGRVLRLFYWKPENGNVYRASLRAAGFEVRANGSYSQRDQVTAFFWMEAVAGSVKGQ